MSGRRSGTRSCARPAAWTGGGRSMPGRRSMAAPSMPAFESRSETYSNNPERDRGRNEKHGDQLRCGQQSAEDESAIRIATEELEDEPGDCVEQRVGKNHLAVES